MPLVALVLSVLTCAAFGLVRVDASRAAWNPAACALMSGPGGLQRDARCVGGREMRTRGYLKQACVAHLSPMGAIYNSRSACGGGGPEYIAQSRVAAALGTGPGTQWEVRVFDASGQSGRADITSEDPGSNVLEVYEAKVMGSGFGNPYGQANGYRDALSSVVQRDAVLGSDSSGNVATLNGAGVAWVDTFVAERGPQATCVLDGQEWPEYNWFVSFMPVNGVIAVFEQELPCFNPYRDSPLVQVPTLVPRVNGIDVPIGRIPPSLWTQPWHAFPGMPLPKPKSGGGGSPPDPFPPIPLPTPSSPPGAPSPPWSPPPPPPGPGPQGEPHMTTFDGLRYDLQSVGEFQLAQSDTLGLDVQIRTTAWNDDVSVTDRSAATVNDHRVEITADHRVLIDGQEVTLEPGYWIDLSDGAYVKRIGDEYTLVWPGQGDRPELAAHNYDFTLYSPPADDLSGLLGSKDGHPENDLVTGWGEQLPSTVSASTIHGSFVDTWRVDDNSSLFSYAEGQSTATFTDRGFPSRLLTINDLSDAALADGTARCRTAGVVDGQQFDDCVLDWAQTHDMAFIDSAAQQVQPVTQPGARSVSTATGTVDEDFDGAVAPNFASPRYGSGAGSGTFAGPFPRSGRYVYYVPDLPAHSDATVSFNLIAFGTWSPFDDKEARVRVDGTTVWHEDIATLTPSRSGTTPSGVDYAVYPVTVSVPHSAGQLNVGVEADIPLASDRAFGVDDVETHVTLVPPQEFTLSLPQSISDGQPATGAGRLENAASEDHYAFSLAAGKGALQVDFSSCSSSLGSLKYRLYDETRDAVAREGLASCGSELIPGLAPGDYTLEVSDHGQTGTYALALSVPPAAQAFDVSLPAAIADGAPSTGAGNLETTSSEDVYRFELPSTSTVHVDLSSCSSSVADSLRYELRDTVTHASVGGVHAWCAPTTYTSVAPGSYQLSVVDNGRTGTYAVGIIASAPQVFAAALPATISDQSPWLGAGRLETVASRDDYRFTLAQDGGVQLDFADCTGGLTSVRYRLFDETRNATTRESWSCGSELIGGLVAGDYRLEVSNDGLVGTYELGISQKATPQQFDVSLPASISDGTPSVGAGKLETTSSQDVYRFTTAAAGAVRIGFSGCSALLDDGSLKWELRSRTTGQLVESPGSGCGNYTYRSVLAGDYAVFVSDNGRTGTYGLALSAVAPQTFAGTLPIASATAGSGAGSLETSASQDDYRFTLPADGAIQLDFADCTGGLTSVHYRLYDETRNATTHDAWTCGHELITGLGSGDYRLEVNSGGQSGGYGLTISERAAPDTTDVTTLPANLSGNLETTSSKDIYRFTTATSSAVRVEMSSCASSLDGWSLQWELRDRSSGQTVEYERNGCEKYTYRSVPAGDYELVVSDNGRTGIYALALNVVAPQTFAVTLPASVQEGQPAVGAGNLEDVASEDAYRFTLGSSGGLQLDFSDCLGGTNVHYILYDETRNATTRDAWSCSSELITGLVSGDYRLKVQTDGPTGTYKVRISEVVLPQAFDVSLPQQMGPDTPSAGMGDLETTSAKDVYRFTTASAGAVRVELSNCASSLNGGSLQWELRNRTSNSVVEYGRNGCEKYTYRSVPAGDYELAVSDNGRTGTYQLGLDAVAPQRFNLTLPVSAQDGQPSAGAGRLERAASEDDYRFTLPHDGGMQLDFSDCLSGNSVHYRLFDETRNVTTRETWTCGHELITGLASGEYRLEVNSDGQSGTYKVAISQQATPEVFAVTLPVTASDGVPTAGMGDLETTSSKDAYRFTTTAAGAVRVAFSDCASSLDGGSLQWELRNRTSNSVVEYRRNACGSYIYRSVPAGNYELVVSDNGRTGTYKMALLAAATQTFSGTLPISSEALSSGAGNLETAASEDDYRFTLSSNGGLQLDFSDCLSGSIVHYRLYDESRNATTRETWTCGHELISGLGSGDYRLEVSADGQSGTYKMAISQQATPQTFDTSLPASIGDGTPSGGMGNLETTSSNDVYRFTTTVTSAVRVELSDCASSLDDWNLQWELRDRTTNQVVEYAHSGCEKYTYRSLPAGDYALSVADNGRTGVYELTLDAIAPQSFSGTLPISSQTAGAGAGNLEAAASEDDYHFSLPLNGSLRLAFSNCTTASSAIQYRIYDETRNAQTKSWAWSCGTEVITGLGAGDYRVEVVEDGHAGTYELAIDQP